MLFNFGAVAFIHYAMIAFVDDLLTRCYACCINGNPGMNDLARSLYVATLPLSPRESTRIHDLLIKLRLTLWSTGTRCLHALFGSL